MSVGPLTADVLAVPLNFVFTSGESSRVLTIHFFQFSSRVKTCFYRALSTYTKRLAEIEYLSPLLLGYFLLYCIKYAEKMHIFIDTYIYLHIYRYYEVFTDIKLNLISI